MVFNYDFTNTRLSVKFEYRDHLGNLRLSFRDSSVAPVGGVYKPPVVVQSNDYDPWGMDISSFQQNNFKYSGKERITDFNLGWDNFGARMYSADIGRFNKIDRYADKYFHLTPYQYAANNPMKYIDVNGDSLLIIHKKESILYHDGKLYYANSGLKEYKGKALDKNGNLKGFVKQAYNALQKIENGGEAGKTLISDIQSFNGYVTIKNDKNGTNGVRVTWSPGSSDGGLDEKGNTSRPSYIGLGHELAHAHDLISDKSVSYNNWYTPPGLSSVPLAEVYATHYENMLRAENKLPLREYYSSTAIKELRLIDTSGNSLWFLNLSPESGFTQYNYKKR